MNQFAEKAQEKPASPQPRKLKTPKEENDFLSIFALYLGFIAAVIALIVGLVLLNKGAISAKLLAHEQHVAASPDQYRSVVRSNNWAKALGKVFLILMTLGGIGESFAATMLSVIGIVRRRRHWKLAVAGCALGAVSLTILLICAYFERMMI